jgi:hypothetical protein
VSGDQQKKPPDWTDSDRAALEHAREELREHNHRQWLWASLGRIAKWALAAVAGTTVVADAVLRLLSAWKD